MAGSLGQAGSVSDRSSFKSFLRVLDDLEQSLVAPIEEPRDVSGIVRYFEMTYELSWKVLKKILREQGHETTGAKDVFSKAFQLGFIDNQTVWLAMIESRNQTAHVYSEQDAIQILEALRRDFIDQFRSLAMLVQGSES